MERKRAKVIMLPANKGVVVLGAPPRNYHLYITTDDEIKDNDWFMSKFFGYPLQNTESNRNRVDFGWTTDELNKDFKGHKIIATTDPELIEINCTTCANMGCDKCQDTYFLPQPSKKFIEKYCKVGGIDEVDVEYETDFDGKPILKDTKVVRPKKLKVDSHNTITIHPIKDSWSREEVISLINKSHYDRTGDGHFLTPELKVRDKWFNQNL